MVSSRKSYPSIFNHTNFLGHYFQNLVHCEVQFHLGGQFKYA